MKFVAALLILAAAFSAEAKVTSVELRHGTPAKLGTIEITFSKLVSDSRCPQDVSCFWAGILVAEFTVRANGKQKIVALGNVAGKAVSVGKKFDPALTKFEFGGTETSWGVFTLDSVGPGRKSTDKIPDGEYVMKVSLDPKAK